MKQDQQSKPNITIENHGSLTFIAEQNADIHDNNNCPIYLVPEPRKDDALNDSTKERGKDARTKRLFTTDGVEDLQRTQEEMNRFRNYLTDHHLGQRQLDCSVDNPIHKAIVCFCVKWKRLKYIDKPSPAAVLRFLTNTCGISCAAEPAALCALLGRMFKAEYDKEVFFDVEEYF